MNEPKKIKLFGTRDFSENFDMALTFIKHNYGAILKPLCILIPIILIAVFVAPDTTSLTSGDIYSYDNPMDIYKEIFTMGYFISIFLTSLASFLSFVFVVAYMAEYTKTTDGVVKISDVWSKTLNVAIPVFFASILFGIAVSIGTILCIIPGIIVYVYLGFYIYVYINEGLGIIDSFQRSYDLVKGNWWMTFGFGLVFMILLIIAAMIFTIPTYLAGIGIALDIEFLTGSIYMYIANMISSLGSFILYPIVYMAMGVVYYSLRNQADKIDEETEIDSIGTFNNEDTTQY